LEHAWQLAEQANPMLKSALANLATAEGQLADTQGLLWNNPQITAERVRRTVPDPGLNDRNTARVGRRSDAKRWRLPASRVIAERRRNRNWRRCAKPSRKRAVSCALTSSRNSSAW
jgi:hypothetical protein